MPEIGVYKITNKVTGDFYVGSSSVSIPWRFRKHKYHFRKNNHPNKFLQNVWNKYGEESLSFEVVEFCSPLDCVSREQYYIDFLNPKYNIERFANSSLGRIASEETRKKMSLARTGKSQNQPRWTAERRLSRYSTFDKTIPVVAKGVNETLIFHNILEAHNSGFNKYEIKRHIKGRRKKYRGFIWSFEGDLFLK